MKIPKRYEHCTLENYKADSLEKQEVLQAVAGYGCNFSALRKNGAAITLRGTGGTSRLLNGWRREEREVGRG